MQCERIQQKSNMAVDVPLSPQKTRSIIRKGPAFPSMTPVKGKSFRAQALPQSISKRLFFDDIKENVSPEETIAVKFGIKRENPYNEDYRADKKRPDRERKIAMITTVETNQGESKAIYINGSPYPIKFLNSGNYHNVYTFSSNTPLVIKDQEIPVNEVVLRTLRPDLGINESDRVYKEDMVSFDWLKEKNVPIPKIHIRPDQFVDTMNSKNGFWIIQKCKEEVKPQDEDAFLFAKKWLTLAMQEKKEIINDFYARNLMRDNEGKIVVIDSGFPETGHDFISNMVSYLLHWSEGNEVKLRNLTADFAENERDIYIKKVLKKMAIATP